MDSYKTLIDENRAMGELDHPEDSVVNLKTYLIILQIIGGMGIM